MLFPTFAPLGDLGMVSRKENLRHRTLFAANEYHLRFGVLSVVVFGLTIGIMHEARHQTRHPHHLH